MQTKILTTQQLPAAAEIIRDGGTVVFPTETVYGLGANALDAAACARIFEAKGRPADNPLIVHIDSRGELDLYAHAGYTAFLLWDCFMPGPLSLIMPQRSCIPPAVTAQMDSVAVRCPAHPIARELIRLSGCPIAAPSANLSGRPSPTSFEHVKRDLYGRVDAIIDGGECAVGVESTVLSLVGEKPVLLRPGAVTPEMLREVLGRDGLDIAPSLLEKLDENTQPLSPGMKYRHYAPDAPMYLVEGSDDAVLAFFREKSAPAAGILCWDEDTASLSDTKATVVSMGSRISPEQQSRRLFSALRQFEGSGVSVIYSRTPPPDGVGLALLNRLLRASGFNRIKI